MRFAVLFVSVAFFMGCAEPPKRAQTSLVFNAVVIVPELKGDAVLGYMPFDQLPPNLREGAAKLGYGPGQRVPTKRYSDASPDRTIYFLKPPATNLRTTNPNDWVPQRR